MAEEFDVNAGLLDTALGGSQDRVTKLLTSDVPDFRDISIGIAEAMTGKGSYGLTLNKLRASRINEELGTAKLLMQAGREARADKREDRMLATAEAQARKSKFLPVGKGVFNTETGVWQVEPPKADKDNLVTVGKGLWDIGGNKWVVEPPKEKPAPTNYKNIVFPDGKTEMVDENDAAAMAEAQKRQGRIVGMNITGTPQDFSWKPGAKENAQLRTDISDAEANISELGLAHEALNTEAGKWSTGARDWVARNIAEPLEQAGISEKAGVFTGPKNAEVQAVRTSTRSLLGRFIKRVTGDTSGRYSDRDMQLANAATRVIEDPKTAQSAVLSALKQMQEIETRALLRMRVRAKGVDIRSKDGMVEYANGLQKMFGLTDEAAVDEMEKDLGFGRAKRG